MTAEPVRRTMVVAAISLALWGVWHCDPATALQAGCAMAAVVVDEEDRK